jgi:hypothetical protein
VGTGVVEWESFKFKGLRNGLPLSKIIAIVGLARGIAPTKIIDIVGAILSGCPSYEPIPFNDPSANF